MSIEEIALEAEERMEKSIVLLADQLEASGPAGPTSGSSTRSGSTTTARRPR